MEEKTKTEILQETRAMLVLKKQDEVASKILWWQGIFRKSVQDKNWARLMSSASTIDSLTNVFNALDENLQEVKGAGDFTTEEGKIAFEVKRKLLKIQIENKATSDYIRITKDFVHKMIDTALPQSRPKLYTRNGYSKTQPASVVLSVSV